MICKTIIAIHGWPDTGKTLWKLQLAELKNAGYNIIIIDLPLFNINDNRRYSNKWGYEFTNLLNIIKNDIDNAMKDLDNKQAIFLGHDWGAVICYLFRMNYPQYVYALATIDVGAHMKVPKTLTGRIILTTYQGLLITYWLLPSIIGTPLTKITAKILGAPNVDENVTSSMNYLYFYTWRSIMLKKYQHAHLNPQKYRIDCPIFFAFGSQKPFMLHSNNWLESINERNKNHNDSLIKSYDMGHWISTHPIHGKQYTKDLLEWLKNLENISSKL